MQYLHGLGCEHIVSELRFFDRGIDVYGAKGKGTRTTYGVELKLNDWRRALQQAAIYQLCCDYSFIAVPVRAILNLDLEPFRASGVGVLVVREEGTVGEVLEARRSQVLNKFHLDAMKMQARLKEPYGRE